MKQKTVEKLEVSPYVTVPEAARLLFLSTPTIRRLLTERRLSRYKAAGRTLLLRAEVMNFIQRQAV